MSTPTPWASAPGEMIHARRIAHGFSQEELAAHFSELGSDLRQPHNSRIEQGQVDLLRRPRLADIPAALGMALGEVLAPPGGRPGGSRQTDGGWESPAWIMLVATMIDHGLEASATCVMLEKERP